MRVLFLAGFFLLGFRAYRRHHVIPALLVAVLGVWLVRYFQPVSDWLSTLGEDSLGEVQKFAWSEAFFFLQTLNATLVPMHWDRVLVLVVFAAVVAVAVNLALQWSCGHFAAVRRYGGSGRGVTTLAVMFILVPVGLEVAKVLPQFQLNSTVYAGARRGFEGNESRLKPVIDGPQGMRVIVYIGEATTSMHWSLYGYGLPTTPRLAAFAKTHPGFLQFRHVVSTHTHTSQSLLEALSMGVAGGSPYRQITERPRASLVDVLNRLGIPTLLMSTQSATGTWNLASSIIFSKTTSQVYATASAALGRVAVEGEGTQVWDDVFFEHALQKFNQFRPQGPAVAFLHSYAGHGAYAQNIPSHARLPQEAFLNEVSPKLIYGDAAGHQDGENAIAIGEQKIKSLLDRTEGKQIGTADGISDYDNVMRYIDSILAHLFQQVSADPQPTVVLYFPDHGESSETGVGHDSSRFQIEMVRIPFLMYFNQAAQQLNPTLFAQFQAAVRQTRPASLAEVPATILSLLGYRIDGALHDYRGVGLDAEDALAPIVVRKLADETTYIRSHGRVREHRRDDRDATGPAATIWLNRRLGSSDRRPSLCYEDANTWAKANRGAMVSDCLEATLVVQRGQLDVAPATQTNVGWALQAVARVAAGRHLVLWLDADNLPADQACVLLKHWIDANRTDAQAGKNVPDLAAKLVVELNPKAGVSFPSSCVSLKDGGTSFYLTVPDGIVREGADSAAWGRSLVALGWPSSYSMPKHFDALALQGLLSAPGSRWALKDLSVDQLPWSGGAIVPDADFLLVNTSWDPNSRH